MDTYDVFVAGCGIAGAAASLFAAQKGLKIIQAGSTAEIVFASGLMDVWGDAHPWQAIETLRRTCPSHPYTHMETATIRQAMEQFLNWLGDKGLPYRHGGDSSCHVLTPMGALKQTWAVPLTMWAGVEAVQTKAPTLLVGFAGLREYSATQIAAVAGKNWPDLRAIRLEFPVPIPHPLLPGRMAQALEYEPHCQALARAIEPHLHDAAFVGLPAILGHALPNRVHPLLEQLLGRKVFEIPTLPASVPGMRLKSVFESHLDKEGVTPRRLFRATAVHPEENVYRIILGGQALAQEIKARQIILATGRFIGRGLKAYRDGIQEPLMHLPVSQPESRKSWHHKDLFARQGHPINRAGIMTDAQFRPVDEKGTVVYPHVYAAGTVLAYQDWIREKCGAGLAIATAWAAVNQLA